MATLNITFASQPPKVLQSIARLSVREAKVCRRRGDVAGRDKWLQIALEARRTLRSRSAPKLPRSIPFGSFDPDTDRESWGQAGRFVA